MPATERKTSRIKRIRVFSKFLLIFPTCLKWQIYCLVFLDLNSWWLHKSYRKRKKIRGRFFRSSMKRRWSQIHLVGSRLVAAKKFTKKPKSVMHMYSCCFALSHCFSFLTFSFLWPSSLLKLPIVLFLRAELQIQTTQDYATDSWFFNVFTG